MISSYSVADRYITAPYRPEAWEASVASSSSESLILRNDNTISLRKLVNDAIVELDRAPFTVAANTWQYAARMIWKEIRQ